jgi:hypothetical protein
MLRGRVLLWLLGVLAVLGFSLGASATPPGQGGGTGVEMKARVGGQIVLEILSGDKINFTVDPLNNPEATATTEILVRTNAASYSITASFGAFLIGDYDLIKNGKFFIRSRAPGKGKAIADWTVPKDEVVILKGEDGLTSGEITVVEYLLRVDFTVPPGEGKLVIIFTAVPEF